MLVAWVLKKYILVFFLSCPKNEPQQFTCRTAEQFCQENITKIMFTERVMLVWIFCLRKVWTACFNFQHEQNAVFNQQQHFGGVVALRNVTEIESKWPCFLTQRISALIARCQCQDHQLFTHSQCSFTSQHFNAFLMNCLKPKLVTALHWMACPLYFDIYPAGCTVCGIPGILQYTVIPSKQNECHCPMPWRKTRR